MKETGKSAGYLAENVRRLAAVIPNESKKKMPASTLRTAAESIKSPTLRTVDRLAELLDTPAWMLIHPEMERWDKHRDWIEHLVRAYLGTSPQGRELIQSAVRAAEQMALLPPIKEKVE